MRIIDQYKHWAVLLLIMAMELPVSGQSQIPAAFERDMEVFNAKIYEALKILDTQSEANALWQIESMKPELEVQLRQLEEKWGDLELTDAQEIEIGNRILQKQIYKDMIDLISNPEFIEKVEGSPALKREYDYLMSLTNGEEEVVEKVSKPSSQVCTFTVKGAVPYAGSYAVTATEDEAYARIDENDLLAVEITATLNDGEFILGILTEEPKTGEMKWNMESQIIIQSWDEEQNEVIQLSSYYYDGTLTFDKVGGTGGTVSGSFKGKFFDDTGATEDPVEVQGRFNVKRIENVY